VSRTIRGPSHGGIDVLGGDFTLPKTFRRLVGKGLEALQRALGRCPLDEDKVLAFDDQHRLLAFSRNRRTISAPAQRGRWWRLPGCYS